MIDAEFIDNGLISIFTKYKRILLYIKGSPDPDVLASSFFLKIMGGLYDVEVDILSRLNVSLMRNKVMIELLRLPVTISEEAINLKKYEGYAILDFQSSGVEEIGNNLNCIIHIDHHSAMKEIFIPEFDYVNEEAGSVSTIMTFLISLYADKIENDVLRRLSTALYYGIMTDTDNLSTSSPEDKKAIEILSDHYDIGIYDKIANTPLSEKAEEIIKTGHYNTTTYKDWIISGIGYVPESNRDSISILAGDLLKANKDINMSVVFALIGKKNGMHLDASFRAKSKSINLNSMIKQITQNGGGRQNKGAFQINMDFFNDISNKDLFWEFVNEIMLEKLKKLKDSSKTLQIRYFVKKVMGLFRR
jgi:nanoRNase/pAp phosphatase (c-di-AMP/oligoRNAs hydrolase)